jgi:hypothetical protein
MEGHPEAASVATGHALAGETAARERLAAAGEAELEMAEEIADRAE